MRDFEAELTDCLENFDMETALALSDELHAYEYSGRFLTEHAELLWERLMAKIEGEE